MCVCVCVCVLACMGLRTEKWSFWKIKLVHCRKFHPGLSREGGRGGGIFCFALPRSTHYRSRIFVHTRCMHDRCSGTIPGQPRNFPLNHEGMFYKDISIGETVTIKKSQSTDTLFRLVRRKIHMPIHRTRRFQLHAYRADSSICLIHCPIDDTCMFDRKLALHLHVR